MVKKRLPDDMSLSSSFCAVARERMERGQSYLLRAQEYYPELREHEVKDTPADGICFLHAIVLQVELEKQYSVWDIAVSFLHWMSARKPEWAAYVDDDCMDERVENLRVHGVMREIERRSTCIRACDFNAICGGSGVCQRQARVRDRIRRNIMESRAHHAWQVYNFDVLLVALEILPPLTEASDSSEPSSSDEESSYDGNGGTAPKQKPITKESDAFKDTKT
jgi:hypothetical protein